MSKLAWVLLPLLLVGATLGWLAWRGRLPTRLSMNVWFSVLLLVYLGTTAGLGIFWVANQHLPVFDWHYLFGYATVGLLLVHLAFNFRVVWRHWFKPKAPPAVDQRRGRLSLLGAVGALAGLGAGYWLGLRHGRTELHIEPASAAAPRDTSMAIVERFHEFSAHSRLGAFRRAPGVDWGDAPPPFKAYPGRETFDLPRPSHEDLARETLDLAALSTLLWHAAAVNLQRGTIHFRSSPSSGALFATELYLVVREVDGLAPGLWHYDGLRHALHRLRTPVPQAQAQAEVIATAVFRRSGHKYRDRAYRYVLADLGHLLENLRATAAVLGLATGFVQAFDEAAIAELLEVDEADEGVLARVILGDQNLGQGGSARIPWTAPLPSGGAALGVTDAIHRATSLRHAAPPDTAAGPLPASAPAGPAIALPEPVRHHEGVLARIARRRSIRRYRDEPITQPMLAALLDAALRANPALYSDAVRLHLVSHAVEGLPVASWRYRFESRTLHRSSAAAADRAESRRAALDQDVIGDAAVVVVLTIARAAFAADAAGAARGYRHAFLEAGLIGERLYLEGMALGLGVCGVGAFYDDEASALIGVDPVREWPVHFVAVGRPA